MPRNSIFLLVGAIVLGIIAVLSVRMYLTAPKQAAAPVEATVMVVAAAKPIAGGTEVKKELLKLVKLPAASLPPGVYRTVDEAAKAGHVALRNIDPNEIIVEKLVSSDGSRLSSTGRIAPGKRAAAVKLTDVGAIGGLVLPGDKVDVLVTRTFPQNGDMITDVLFQNVRVLAVDQEIDPNKDKSDRVPASATIEVTAEQAQKLALAQTAGTVSLALRSVVDGAPLPGSRTVKLRDLNETGTARPAPPAPNMQVAQAAKPDAPRYRGPVVEIFHGADGRKVPLGSSWAAAAPPPGAVAAAVAVP
jgi:pilus assembly protein CpaB